MSVMRWDPWHELANLQRDVSELFGRASGVPATRTATIPPMDIYRTDEGMVMLLELPGSKPDRVEVTVDDGVLTISGERRPPEDVAPEQWVRRERPIGSFTRSLTLPDGVDPGQIKAAFVDGLLRLEVPHPPDRRPQRVQIDLSTGNAETVDVSEHRDAAVGGGIGQGADPRKPATAGS